VKTGCNVAESCKECYGSSRVTNDDDDDDDAYLTNEFCIVRFEVFTAVTMKNVVFLDVAL
jgi:hypothetical protein